MSDELFNPGDDAEVPNVHDDPTWSEESAARFEADPSTVAFLDQEAAAFQEIAVQFAETYGFNHECHCDTDYSSGKIVEVTECFAGMVVEALETCGRLNTENKALKEMLTVMFRLNNELVEANSGAVSSETPEAEVVAESDADTPASV